MKYQHIKVDMDYCAYPLWCSEDGVAFANDSLSEYKGKISVELMQALILYQNLWENYNWDYTGNYNHNIGYEDSVAELLEEMQIKLAVRLKEELPELRVHYSVYHEQACHYETVEVNFEQPKGIYSTLVG